MILLSILVGVALLCLGRKLYWLFVGGIGFAGGMALAMSWWPGRSDSAVLIIGLIGGVVGALLAVFLQRIAIGLAGFVSGGYALLTLAERTGHADIAWIGFLVGGVLGTVLVSVLFDWALIVLSSLTGSILIAENVPLEPAWSGAAFLLLFLLGLAIQAAQMRRRVSSSPEYVQPSDGTREER